MFTVLLIAGAIALLYGDKTKALVESVKAKASKIESHQWLAGSLLALSGYVYYTENYIPPAPEPEPEPAPIVSLDLRGKFIGETASEDAAAVCSICDEIARELEWDGKQSEPFFKTGAAFDELRIRTRTMLMKGESIGDRHPLAREAIEQWLNEKAGTSGGPLTPAGRSKWVSAYRDVARAAEAAYR